MSLGCDYVVFVLMMQIWLPFKFSWQACVCTVRVSMLFKLFEQYLYNICFQGRLLCHNIWPRRLSDLGRFEQQTLCYPHRQRGAGFAVETF